MIVDLQISPAACEWTEFRDASLRAEGAGYSALWAFDHLAGAALGGHTMLECFSLLGALAEATTSIELGCLVANVWNRQVGTLLAAAASVSRISGRRFHLGVGAGTSPTSRWAAEQLAVGAELSPSIEVRHARVEQLLRLAHQTWNAEPDAVLATLPQPSPPPSVIVGVNSERLSRLAGKHADGVNVAWHHPHRDALLAAAQSEVGNRRFERSVWTHFDLALLDPEHPQRTAMDQAGIDRLILAVLGPELPDELGTPQETSPRTSPRTLHREA